MSRSKAVSKQAVGNQSVDKLAAAIARALRAEGIGSLYPEQPVGKPELAEFLSVSEWTIDNYIAARRIPFIKLNGHVLFNLADVQQALKRHTFREVK